MHEAAFSQAARPAPARVLGLTLRPYSIGHELCLIRENNSLALNQARTEIISSAMVHDLIPAVLFCAQTWEEIAAMNRDPLINLKLWIWNRRLRRINILRELAAFLEYQADGAREFPGEAPYCANPGRPRGTPELLRLHAFVWLNLGKGEVAAWDYPLGLAKMYYAGQLEHEGQWNVRGEFEEQYDKSRDEWMATNPGNTLRKVGRNA